ncbi:MAG: class I SAM-dependent methyltransferase [Holophagales bacterium]|nr:class I SAM-dependent methyltransferase [Holophagales bacterium]
MSRRPKAEAEDGSLTSERARIVAENRRRAAELDAGRYAPWNPAERLMVDSRRRLAARLLERAGAFPGLETPCLEVGFGSSGWLTDLLYFGVSAAHVHGVEIDASRCHGVRRRLPSARLCVADAGRLPFTGRRFGLVVASTVLTSILEPEVQERVAGEIHRVLRPGGALLYYDFAVSNPRNPHVRGLSRRRLRELFPDLRGEVRSTTLAPPLARSVAPRSHALATLLEALPFLRTHLLAVLLRPR